MELNEMTNEDLVSLATACLGDDEGDAHDESTCLGCQAWAVYEARGCQRLS